MSIFAINVVKGQEIYVKDMISKFLEMNNSTGLINKIHAFETHTRKLKEKRNPNEVLNVCKSAFSEGYIFVELKSNFFKMPAQLWHIIKSVPKVIRILNNPVPEEEFQRLYENIQTESEVEVVAVEEVIEVNEKEILHKANTSSDKREMKEYLSKLDGLNDNRNRLINKAEQAFKIAAQSSKLNALVKRCKAFIRNKRQIFVFPFRLFQKARQKIDPDQTLTVRELKENDLIIHSMIELLEREAILE